MATEAQKKAIAKYRAKSKRLTVDFNKSDADLWEHLQKQPNKQGYIKALIRADMERKHGDKLPILIYRDDMDDYCSFKRFFYGTEEEAERYCSEYNKNCRYVWEQIEWVCLEDYKE